MESNLGPYDQLVRIVIGVAIGWECFLMPTHHGLLMFFSLAFLLSGFIGFCPVYALVGGSTNRAKSDADGPNRWPSP
jgi:amino acid transporter